MTNAESPQQTSTLTIDQALQQAIAHHQAGQLQDAERLYRAILQTQPNHPDANHNLGVLAVQVKQPIAGLPYFRAALEFNPNQEQYWLSYIDALIQTGQIDVARQVLEQGRQRGLQGETTETLAGRLESSTKVAVVQLNTEYQHEFKEVLSATSAVSQDGKRTPKTKPTKPDKSARQPAPRKGKKPSPQEINKLVTLFTAGRYTEAATLAQTLTVRFPLHGFGWKVLGAALKQMDQSADALMPMQKAAVLLPNDAEVYSNLGNTLTALGRLDEAEACYRQALQIKPGFAEAYSNLGNTLNALGRLDEAEVNCRQALQLKPDYAEAHSNLGDTLNALGRLDEAEACYRQALQIKPDYAEVYSNLGITLKALGRLDEAEASYRRALQIKPGYAEAHNNLGITLKALGRLDEAEASYRWALQIKPGYAEAHNNLGNTLTDQGRLNEAEASYRRALQIKPDFVEALDNLSLLFNGQGQPMMALDIIKQSLRIRETEEAKRIFVACVKHLRYAHNDSEIQAAMVRALTEPWERPSELARSCTNFVKLNPNIGGCVARASDAWPRYLSAPDLFGADGLTILSDDPLLCALLNTTPICDMEMERFLTMARHTMLAATAADSEIDATLSFYCALARQCFINEYVFSHTTDEIQQASDLRDALVSALAAKTQVPALWVVAVAAYFPLYSHPHAARLLERQWPQEVVAVLVQQVREPTEESQLRTNLPRLTSIEDAVSLLVQNQYEENPYPRWVKVASARKTKNVLEYLCQKFPLVPLKRHTMSGNIDILIAGCGTGQQSIETAQQFQNTRVLAIDLSLSSLGYAKRKTQELGLTSIEYAQADLLKLGSLGRSFDVVESVGVLHHLADPLAGWQILLSLLRPGGFMRLGFYSEVARRNIVRIRTFIAEQGYGSTPDEIRRLRQDLMNLNNGTDFGNTTKSFDFFSISTCRDLLFHVQEQRMSLSRIDTFLRENNLALLGLGIDPHVLHAYKQRFPDDRAAINLGQWQIFENENPDTFFGMYQFWIQKVDLIGR